MNVNDARLLKGTNDTSTWAHYGGSYNEQRFSPLKKINDANVKDLGLAWYADYDTNQNQHGSPLYVDGVIYVSTARNVVHAFDARDGKRLWTYTPLMIPNPNLGLVNRGIAAYNGKIYMGMLDARLVAIDAKTGKPAWNIDTVPESLGLRRDAQELLHHDGAARGQGQGVRRRFGRRVRRARLDRRLRCRDRQGSLALLDRAR